MQEEVSILSRDFHPKLPDAKCGNSSCLCESEVEGRG